MGLTLGLAIGERIGGVTVGNIGPATGEATGGDKGLVAGRATGESIGGFTGSFTGTDDDGSVALGERLRVMLGTALGSKIAVGPTLGAYWAPVCIVGPEELRFFALGERLGFKLWTSLGLALLALSTTLGLEVGTTR